MFVTETKGRIHTVTCISCGFLRAASADPHLLLMVMEIHKAWHQAQRAQNKKKPQSVNEPPYPNVAARYSIAA